MERNCQLDRRLGQSGFGQQGPDVQEKNKEMVVFKILVESQSPVKQKADATERKRTGLRRFAAGVPGMASVRLWSWSRNDSMGFLKVRSAGALPPEYNTYVPHERQHLRVACVEGEGTSWAYLSRLFLKSVIVRIHRPSLKGMNEDSSAGS